MVSEISKLSKEEPMNSQRTSSITQVSLKLKLFSMYMWLISCDIELWSIPEEEEVKR